MKSYLKRFWPILVILGLVVALACPFWVKGLIPFPSNYLVTFFPPWQYYFGMPVKNNAMPDVITQMFPWKHLVIGLWTKGIFPLWNPNNFSGSPLLANYQSAVFHPANFLFFVFPEIAAWSIMILLQPLLAGLFTYLFARQLKLNQLAALISAISFMFCGFMICWLAYGTMSYALLWLPLILYAIEKNFQKISPPLLLLISSGLAASFFSGHFQTSLYVLLAALIFLIYKFIASHNKKSFFGCLLFLFLGISLAAVQILPTFEFYQYSVRSQIVSISEIVPWRHLITLLAPDFYGNPVTRNDWFGHYAEWAGFAGVIPFLLAIYIAVKKSRRPPVFFFAFLAVISLILTRPTPLLDLIVKLKIPVLSSSAASRVVGLFSFSIAVLAGFGFDQLRNDLKKKNLKPILSLTTVALGLILVIWLLLLVVKPFPAEWLPVAKRNFIMTSGMVLIFTCLLIIFWLIRKPKTLVLMLLFFLTVFDLFRFARKWLPFDSSEYVYPSLPILEFLNKTVGCNRLFGNFGMEVMNYYQIPGFTGYDPVYIQRYGELMMANNEGRIGQPSGREVRFEKGGKYTLPLLNLLGGKYLLHARADDQKVWTFPVWKYPKQFKMIYEDDQYQVYENLAVYPRAFLAYEYRIVKEPQQIIDKMFAASTDLRQTLILEEEPALTQSEPKNPGKAEIIDYQNNRVKILTQTETPALLFLSDNYYPGWQAAIDGQLVKIYRADYSFRAVLVPAGNHQVEFRYHPTSFRLGIITSGLSLLSVVIIASYLKFKK